MSFVRLLSMASGLLLFASAQAVDAQELRKISNQFKTEPGCPVDLISAKTELEIDSFGAPSACRIFLDVKNSSAKPISAIKFRMGYIDEQEKIRRTFTGDDAHLIAPAGQAHQQWRVAVDPKAAYVVIRPIAVKFDDGSEWRSEKFRNPLTPPPEGSGNQGAEVGATDPADAGFGSADEKQSGTAGNNQRGSSSGGAGSADDPSSTPVESGSSSASTPQSDKTGDGY